MKKSKKLLTAIIVASAIISATHAEPCIPNALTAEAHSGRTDSSGGHHDYNNVSGLGSYHYHCGGYPAHLHPGGICPYSSGYDEPDDTPAPKPAFKLKMNKKALYITVGKRNTLKLNTSSKKVTWRSSRKKVATVKNGVITAKKPGRTTISAKYNGQIVKCNVTVFKKIKNPVSLATSCISIQTLDWNAFSDDICFCVKNNTSETIRIHNTLKAFNDNYRYIGTMKMPFSNSVTIAPGSKKKVTFLDFGFSGLIFDTQRFNFKMEIGATAITCRAEYNYDYDLFNDIGQPYIFSFHK